MIVPWERLDAEAVVDCPWFTLRAETWRMGDGRMVSPYYVVQPPNWVTVIAVTPQEEVVLVQQFRPGMGACTLELPSGSVDAEDTDLLAAMHRELREETGYGGGAWDELIRLSPNPANHANHFTAFFARGVTPQGMQQLDQHEDIAVRLVPVPEFIDMAYQGQLPHALQVSALFYALPRLQGEA